MAEEKIVKINLRNKLKDVPRWRKRAVIARLIKERLKSSKMKISQKLNDHILSGNGLKFRLKLVKDDKQVKAELADESKK